jgi:hypothetical protein
MNKATDTIHLVLRYKWYDMIASGEKTEEYRNIQTWKNRFGDNIKYVTFHRGYSAVTMTYRIKSVSIGIGKTAWGALEDKEVLIIKLGDRT